MREGDMMDKKWESKKTSKEKKEVLINEKKWIMFQFQQTDDD